MRRIVAVVLVVAALAMLAGIMMPAFYQARRAEEFARCQNNLRQLGSFALLHPTMPGQPVPVDPVLFFPAGTIVNPMLPPDQRLSWYVSTLQALGQGSPDPKLRVKKPLHFDEMLMEIDVSKPWDAETNQRAARYRLVVALCPAVNPSAGEGQPALTDYFGNGGIGQETAALTVKEAGPNAGPFRYDAPTPLEEIQAGDGLSNTILLAESATNLGPWLRGGPSTIRSLFPDEPPYLGPGRLYAGCHLGRGNFSLADGSVRVIADRVDPLVFRALLTINGGEKEANFADDH